MQCSSGEQQLVNFMQVTDLECSFQGERTDIAGEFLNASIGWLFYFTSESWEHLALQNPGIILQTEHLLLPHPSPRLGKPSKFSSCARECIKHKHTPSDAAC